MSTRKPIAKLEPGLILGNWEVLQIDHVIYKKEHWLCRCLKCRATQVFMDDYLKSGRHPLCFCLKKNKEIRTQDERLLRYWWTQLRKRFNPNHEAYVRWGALGITLCEHWQTFEGFAQDMAASFKPGFKLQINNPKKLLKKKLEINKDFCCWVAHEPGTRLLNQTTAFVNFDGQEVSLKAIYNKFHNLNYVLVYQRIFRLGWDVEKAIKTPQGRNSQCQTL